MLIHGFSLVNARLLKAFGTTFYAIITVKKLSKDYNSGKNQSSMTSVKYDHLQVMETITGKFHQNPLRNVGGVAETRISIDKKAKTDKGP